MTTPTRSLGVGLVRSRHVELGDVSAARLDHGTIVAGRLPRTIRSGASADAWPAQVLGAGSGVAGDVDEQFASMAAGEEEVECVREALDAMFDVVVLHE